jgi:glutathione S-transferase
MSDLVLHLHPLSSYCHKVLIGLYEMATPFTIQTVNLQDAAARADYLKLSPFGKIPALEDTKRNVVINESSTILEYAGLHYPGKAQLIPRDADAAITVRMWDRFLDMYLHQPMQRVVAEKFRPDGSHDPFGEKDARASLRRAYDVLEKRLGEAKHPGGDTFSLADCAAAPALFYAQAAEPFADSHPRIARYFESLLARPSYARTLDEAKPFLKYFPLNETLPARFKN